MSYIQTIQVRGLKGLQRDFNLSPITYIIGPNKSNKTSIIDAIKVALLGYYPKPDVPKTNVGTMRLASSAEMSLAVTMADGRAVRRWFSLSGSTVKKVTDPADFEVDPFLALCLDHSLYFGKTDTEKVQQIINMAQNVGDDKRIPEIIARIKMLKATDHNGRAEILLHSILKTMPQPEKKTVQQWLGELLEFATTRYKSVNAALKEFTASNRTLSEANAIDVLQNETEKAGVVAKIDGYKKRQAELTEEWGRRKEQHKQHGETMRSIATMRANLDKIKNDILPVEKLEEIKALEKSNVEDSKRLSSDADALNARQDALAESSTSINNTVNNLADNIEEARSAFAAAGYNISSIRDMPLENSTTKLLREKATELRLDCAKVTVSLDQTNSMMNQIVAFAHCPTCRAEHTGWKEHALARYQGDVDQLKLKIKGIEAEIASVIEKENEERKKIEAERSVKIEKEVKAQKAAEANIVELDQKLKVARAEANTLREAYSKLSHDAKPLRQQAREAALRAEHYSEIIGEQENARSMIGVYEEQLKDSPQLGEAPSIDQPEEMKTIARQLFEAEAALTQFNNQEAERKRIEQLKAHAAELTANLELTKKLGETVKDEQAKIVEGAFGPVLRVANTLTRGILETPLDYQDGQIGRKNAHGGLISVSTFSGSETLATYMAITAALARDAKDRIGIIDEIGTFDLTSIAALLENAEQCVLKEKLLDQIVIVGTVRPTAIPAHVQVIET